MRSCAAALAYENGANSNADIDNDNIDYADSTLDDLILVFCGWLIAHIIALIVFVLELVCSYYRIK